MYVYWKAQPHPDFNTSARVLHKLWVPNIMKDSVPNRPGDYYTCAFRKSKMEKLGFFFFFLEVYKMIIYLQKQMCKYSYLLWLSGFWALMTVIITSPTHKDTALWVCSKPPWEKQNWVSQCYKLLHTLAFKSLGSIRNLFFFFISLLLIRLHAFGQNNIFLF